MGVSVDGTPVGVGVENIGVGRLGTVGGGVAGGVQDMFNEFMR